MSEHVNYQNKVISAGSFVQVSTKRASAKEKLRDVLASISSENTTETLNFINSVLSDNVVSPEEKIALESRWATIRDSYNRLRQTIKDAYGDEELESLSALDELLTSINRQMEIILADRYQPTTVPASFETNFSEFLAMYSNISIAYSKDMYETMRYSIRLESDNILYNDGENVTVFVHLFKDDEEVTGIDFSRYELSWRITGADIDANQQKYRIMQKDGETIVKQGISIPAVEFTESITINCSMNIPTESSLPS